MADDLRKQYDTIVTRLDAVNADTPIGHVAPLILAAVCHILARLGPPEPLDGIEAEKLTDAGD